MKSLLVGTGHYLCKVYNYHGSHAWPSIDAAVGSILLPPSLLTTAAVHMAEAATAVAQLHAAGPK
jgi:hypothetical protein